MDSQIKVEIEVKAFGGETIEGFEDSYRSCEVARTRYLPKETTLEQLEQLVMELIKEVKADYDNLEQLLAKVVIRAKMKDHELVYLG